MSQRAVPRPALAERELSFMSVFMSLRMQTDRGSKSDNRAGDDEHGERKDEHARIERHGVETRQLRRADREQRAETERADDDAHDRARGRQHQRLREELTHQPAPSRAQRRAHGHLARPRRAAREQAGWRRSRMRGGAAARSPT